MTTILLGDMVGSMEEEEEELCWFTAATAAMSNEGRVKGRVEGLK